MAAEGALDAAEWEFFLTGGMGAFFFVEGFGALGSLSLGCVGCCVGLAGWLAGDWMEGARFW